MSRRLLLLFATFVLLFTGAGVAQAATGGEAVAVVPVLDFPMPACAWCV